MTQEKESKLLTHVESQENAQVDTIQSSNFTATANEDMTKHELSSLMQRPTLLESGFVLADNSVVSLGYGAAEYDAIRSNLTSTPGLVSAIGFPSAIIQKNPVVASKIKQFAYFKGDMKIDIKINKPPQVSGCLLVVYVPRGGTNDFDSTNLTLQGLTSLPYQILDYSTDTSLTMSVPYIDEIDYFNFQQQALARDYGYILIMNLVAPQSGESAAKVSYSIFGSFQNIELSLPAADVTPTPFVAQSGMVQRIPGDDIMSGVEEKPKLSLNYFTDKTDCSKISYDSNETSLQYVLGRENIIGKLTYGPSLSTPFLGKVRCFPKRPVCRTKTFDLAGVGTNTPNFSAIPQQMGTFDYTCNLFQRWTGTIEIGIRLIKTKFHYGRIAVVFDPFNTLEDETTLGSLLSTNYSAIIDLNAEDGSEGSSNYYRFPIPYMNNVGFTSIGRDYGLNTKFCDTQEVPTSGSGVTTTPADLARSPREIYNPHLRFYALTELGFLDVAANNVPMLISIRAGNDFQLSLPSVNVARARPAIAPEDPNFYCQSGSIQLIPNSSNQTVVNEKTCNNETITDLLSLTKRFTPVRTGINTKQPLLVTYTTDGLRPGSFASITNSSEASHYAGSVVGLVNGPESTGTFKMSNIQAIQSLFKFTYGGRKYKCMASEVGSTMMARLIHRGAVRNENFSYASNSVPRPFDADPLTSFPLTGTMIVNTGINNFIEVERNFSSNRKLVSENSDDVLLHIVSYSPTRHEELFNSEELPSRAHLCKVGPLVRSFASDYDGDIYKVGAIDLSNGSQGLTELHAAVNNIPRFYREFSDVCPEEGNYLIRSGNFGVAKVNNSAVLEAMPENAGFTFLKNPPCVQFL